MPEWIWQGSFFSWAYLAKSALGRAVGISLYVVALRPMSTAGDLGRDADRRLQWLDQAIAVLTVVALGWLLVRTGG